MPAFVAISRIVTDIVFVVICFNIMPLLWFFVKGIITEIF
jgi:hypothetical protein